MTRGRKPFVIRNVRFHIAIPEDISSAVRLRLYSDVQGRVPYGAFNELVTELLREWLAREAGK